MSLQQQELPSADDVLKDIARELERPVSQDPSFVQAMQEVKRRQQDFRSSPVIGSLLLLKQLVFSLNRSTFLQQLEMNERILELVDDLYYELVRSQVSTDQRLARLERALQANSPEQISMINENSVLKTAELPYLKGLPTIYSISAELLMPERLLLYGLVYGLKPAVCLEIGTFHGGSSLLICAAMDDSDFGRLVCVDPNPKIATADWEKISHRASLVRASSPEALPQAVELAGQPFDFAFVDGDHSYEGLQRDIEGLLPLLAPDAYLLCHDCFYPDVRRAIDDALSRHADRLIDCGVLSAQVSRLRQGETTEDWAGLRLVRFRGRANGQ